MVRLRPVPDTPRRGVLYLRQSIKTEETISDAIQRAAGTDYCSRNGIQLVTVQDPDWPSLERGEIWEQHTGRVWHRRTGVLKAMSLIEHGLADVIVLWKWNRLSRKRLHWVLAEHQVEQLGGSIESATEPVDTTTATGRFTRAMLVDLGELQSDLIGESWKDTHAVRRARGLPAMGGHKFGYTWYRGPDERYEPREDQAETLRWMYAHYIEGHGRGTITKSLNLRGITNTRGRPWTITGVIQVMDSGFGAGLLVRTAWRDGKVYVPPFPELTWMPGVHQPVIDRQIWEDYRAARLERHYIPPRAVEPTHPLVGLVVCADEGAAMLRGGRSNNANIARSGGPQLKCGAWHRQVAGARCVTVSEARVHRAIREWLQEFVSDIEAASRAADLTQAKRLQIRTDITVAEGELATIQRQLVQATRKHLADIIPEATYIATRNELLAEQAAIEDRIRAAQSEVVAPTLPPVEIAVTLLSDWDILPVMRLRNLLVKLIRKIIIHRSDKPYGRTRIDIIPTWTN